VSGLRAAALLQLHLVGILFPHNIDDARSKPHQIYSEYEFLIAFPQQQWLHECASVLRLYLLVCCLSCYSRVCAWIKELLTSILTSVSEVAVIKSYNKMAY
jgi:hypothetical protein